MISAWTIPLWLMLGTVMATALFALVARGNRRGIPQYPEPPEPPEKRKRWYPLLAHELKAGTMYRHRVTGLNVWIHKAPEEDGCQTKAIGAMWNTVKGEWREQRIADNELETDDITLAPRAEAAFDAHVLALLRTGLSKHSGPVDRQRRND